jgi:hypothetical protein
MLGQGPSVGGGLIGVRDSELAHSGSPTDTM